MQYESKFSQNLSTQDRKPSALPVRADSIPEELKPLRQWVVWRWEWRLDKRGEGKWTKPPFNVASFGYAKSDDPETWASLKAALLRQEDEDNNFDGIGLMLAPPYIGIDLDKCRDPETGEIEAWARRWIEHLNSYTEISPSGKGIKILTKAKVAWTGNKKERIEMYGVTRYFTFTGHHLPGTPTTVEDRQQQVERMHEEIFGKEEPKEVPRDTVSTHRLNDTDVIRRAMAASNGEKFCKLWQGQWEDAYASQSEADLALVSMLAFWTGPDPDHMDRLFRDSGLMRNKWEREDYREDTIEKALSKAEYYRGPLETLGEEHRQVEALFRKTHQGTPTVLPTILVSNRQLRDITQDAIEAICQANQPPQWFQRAGLLCRLRTDSDTGMPFFEPLKENALRGILSRVADWKKTVKADDGFVYKNVSPPEDVVKDVLGLPGWDFLPSVKSIIEAPVFDSAGSLNTEPGYDAKSQLWFHPSEGLQVLPVAEQPTTEDIDQAKRLLLDELLGDFPFVDQASKAHALAAMLLPFVRPLIDGPTPLHALDAPTEGTGKGLLANCITLPATGREAATMPACHRAEEWQKQIMATLIKAPVFVLIDNVKHPLDNDALASVLTTRRHTDRLLGVSQMAEVPVQCVWLTAGNNLHASKEITRRMVRIRLDARMERPGQRTGFHHPDLVQWAKKNRDKLVWACLTLCRAWFAQGCPEGNYTLGSYERWARVIGGILNVAQIPGFLGNLDDLYREVNTSDGEWREFIECWWERWKDTVISSGDAYNLAIDKGLLQGVMGDNNERSRQSRLGRSLSKRLHQCFGQLRIEAGGADRHGSARYKLIRLEQTAATTTPEPKAVAAITVFPKAPCSIATNTPRPVAAASSTNLKSRTLGRIPLDIPCEEMEFPDGSVSVLFRPLTEDEQERLDGETRTLIGTRKDGRFSYEIRMPTWRRTTMNPTG